MPADAASDETLSSWWRRGVVFIVVSGLTILIWLAAKTYTDAPPIPNKVVTPSGDVLFTGDDIVGGQQVFLRYGLMENGTIWGHGVYLGPDFSAEYLHTLADDVGQTIAQQRYSAILSGLDPAQRSGVIRTGYPRGADIVRNDSIPAPKGFDPAMAGKRAEYDGGGPIEGTRFAVRPEFTGTLTGDYVGHGEPAWRWHLMIDLVRKPKEYTWDCVWCESGNVFLIDE